MMVRKTWLSAAGLLGLFGSGALLTLQACVGDDPVTTSSTPDSGVLDSSNGGNDGSILGDGGTDGTTGEGGGDASCTTTPTGKLVGARSFPFVGTNAAVVGTSNGGYAIAASYRNVGVNYGSGGTALPSHGNTEEASVVRFNPDGTVLWQVGYGGDGSDRMVGITVDDKDDVYVTGTFDSASFSIGSFNFAPTVTIGIVAKLDGKTGSALWAKQFKPGPYNNACGPIDFAAGRLVVSCTMGPTQSYDTASGAQVLTNTQVQGASLYGLDPATGNALWARAFGTGSGADASVGTYITSVDVTGGGVVVSGTFNGGTLSEKQTNAVVLPMIGTKPNGFVAELNTGVPAVPLWIKGFGDSTSTTGVYAVTAAGTSASGVVVGGTFGGTVNFGSGDHASVGSTDVFALMLRNKAGAPSWEKYFGGSEPESVSQVRIDACGRPELMLTTYSVLPTTDGVAIPAPQAGGIASLITKLAAADGKLLWANGATPGANPDLNGINQYDFATGRGGNGAFVVGDFRGSVDPGNGMPLTATGGSRPYIFEYAP